MLLIIKENNPLKVKKSKFLYKFLEQVSAHFSELVEQYKNFYMQLSLDKTDIDNLIKSNQYGDAYTHFLKNVKTGATP